jgi:hypothetical protein
MGGVLQASRPAVALLSALALLVAGIYLIAGASDAQARGPGAVFVKSTSFTMSQADQKRRSTVRCPRSKRIIPLGGGMYSSPPAGPRRGGRLLPLL